MVVCVCLHVSSRHVIFSSGGCSDHPSGDAADLINSIPVRQQCLLLFLNRFKSVTILFYLHSRASAHPRVDVNCHEIAIVFAWHYRASREHQTTGRCNLLTHTLLVQSQ